MGAKPMTTVELLRKDNASLRKDYFERVTELKTVRAERDRLKEDFAHLEEGADDLLDDAVRKSLGLRKWKARAEAAELLVKGWLDAYSNGVAVDRDVLDESRAAMKEE